jgi:hypothetical protein
MEENEPNEDVERVERIEGVSEEELQRNGKRKDDESKGRNEIQGDEEREQREAGTHEQSARVGDIAEPATDEDQDESGEALSWEAIASLADSRIGHGEKWKRKQRTRIRWGYQRKRKRDRGRCHEKIRAAIWRIVL